MTALIRMDMPIEPEIPAEPLDAAAADAPKRDDLNTQETLDHASASEAQLRSSLLALRTRMGGARDQIQRFSVRGAVVGALLGTGAVLLLIRALSDRHPPVRGRRERRPSFFGSLVSRALIGAAQVAAARLIRDVLVPVVSDAIARRVAAERTSPSK